uniref:Myelin basic protein n=1 Tax=Knipowitschia caucasica TaxID=637954 RepID=A0AAV2MB86_KNICA
MHFDLSDTVSVGSMGQHLGKREPSMESKAPETKAAKPTEPGEADEVFGLCEADANQNNGCISKTPAVTDSTGTEGPHPPGTSPTTADPDEATPRPHLVRLFSRDAPGREDNTFKERPSESDELQTIQEQSGASECGSENEKRATFDQYKRPIDYYYSAMASASSKKAASPGVLDQIGKIFGGDKKKKSKGSFRGALSPAPQKASASAQKKKTADNAVVSFLRSIVSPAPPKSRGDQKSQPKAKKAAAGDGKGSLTRIFKM